jgi:hypothetical protein
MGVVRGILAVLIVALAIPFMTASVASADSFTKIFLDYQRTGRVDGCKYSAKELAAAQREVPNDIEQYAPDFPAALEAAAEQRASGQCRKGQSTAAPPVAGTPTPPPTPPTAPGATPTPQPAAPVPASPPNAAAPQPTPDPTMAPAAADKAIETAARDARGGGASGTPAPLVVLAIVCGLLALIAGGWGAARWWAWEPRWLARARHAGAEAGWRAGGLWGEFSDWVRLGR